MLVSTRVSVPGGEDSVPVVPGADVLVDEGVEVTRDTEQGVVGLAHGQEERGVVPGGELEDIRDQSRRTQPEHMDA